MRLFCSLCGALALVFLAAGIPCLAEEPGGQAVTLEEAGIAFCLPTGWDVEAVSPDAAREGVVFAARREDGRVQLYARQEPLAEGDGMEAFAASVADMETVSVERLATAEGKPFLLCTERMQDGEASVVYRMASAVWGERWVHLIWIDWAGDGGQAAAETAHSVRSLLPEAPEAEEAEPGQPRNK